MLTRCCVCGSVINTDFGAAPPAAHAGAAGTEEDPRSPGDYDEVCAVCWYTADDAGRRRLREVFGLPRR